MVQTKFPPIALFTVCAHEVNMQKFGEVAQWLQETGVPFETVTSEFGNHRLPCVMVHAKYVEIAEMKIREYSVEHYLFVNEWREAEIRDQRGGVVRKVGKLVKCCEDRKKENLVFVRDADKARQYWTIEGADHA